MPATKGIHQLEEGDSKEDDPYAICDILAHVAIEQPFSSNPQNSSIGIGSRSSVSLWIHNCNRTNLGKWPQVQVRVNTPFSSRYALYLDVFMLGTNYNLSCMLLN